MTVTRLFVHVRNYCHKAPRRYSFSENWQKAFGKHLLFTNTWTSGFLMVIGDVVKQEIEYQRTIISKRYNWGRVGRMFVTGLILGPVHHLFYGWMDRILPQRTIRVIAQKILLDQIVMSPICISLLFYSVGIMEGKNLKESTNELKRKFLSVYMVDWCIWPPTQFINFYVVPVKYQVLYINAVTMVYNVFLSHMKHS